MKNLDYVIKKTSEDLNYPEEVVKKVLGKYWQSAYSKIISANITTIGLRHIGVLTISKFKLAIFIKKKIAFIRYLKKIRVAPEKEEKRWMKIETQMKKLRKALIHRNRIATLYCKNYEN